MTTPDTPTDLVLPAQTETPVPKAVGPPGATEWATIRAMSQTLADSRLVPAAVRGRVDDVTLIVLTGRELGLPPVMALSHVHVVEGKPTLSAETMRALVLRAGHRFRIAESSSQVCAVEVARADRPTETGRFVWTEDDARRAGLLGKDNWKKYPAAMLLARVTSAACRAFFPDVLMGASYTPEELGADEPAAPAAVTGEVIEQPAEPRPEDVDGDAVHSAIYAARSRADLKVALTDLDLHVPGKGWRKALMEAVQTVDVNGQLTSAWDLFVAVGRTLPETTPAAPEPITTDQLTAVNTAASTYGLTDRDARLAWLSDWTADQRQLTSSTQLTKAEAHRLLEELHQRERQGPPPAQAPAEDDVVDAEVLDDQPAREEPDRTDQGLPGDPPSGRAAVAAARAAARVTRERHEAEAAAERAARLTPTTEETR